MKFTYKLNIILGSLFLVSLISIFLLIFFQTRQKSNTIIKSDLIITEEREKYKILHEKLLARNKNIEKQNKTEPKTEKEIIYKKIIEKDTEIINELIESHKKVTDQLEETNNVLKKQNSKKNNIRIFALGGIDQELEVDLYAGLIYSRTVYSGRLVNLNLGGGGAVKIYKNIGGAIELELSIQF